MWSTDKILIEVLLGPFQQGKVPVEEVDPVKKIFFINFSKLSLAGVAILVGNEVINKILKETQLGIIPPKLVPIE